MQAFRRYLYRHLHHILPLPILLAAFFAWLSEPGPFVQFRLNVFDEFLRLKPRQYEPTPVRIVDIDDDSLERCLDLVCNAPRNVATSAVSRSMNSMPSLRGRRSTQGLRSAKLRLSVQC